MLRSKPLLVLLFGGMLAPVCATTYYLAADGLDSRTALEATREATPWKSLTKLAEVTLLPGDRVLLRRGDTFPGTLTTNASGTEAAPIVYGAYGSGAAPVISGTIPLTGWTAHTGGIYKSAVPRTTGWIEQLFFRGVPLTCARTPNTGYFAMQKAEGTAALVSSQAQSPAPDWTGGSVHLKTARWNLESRTIASHDRATGRIAFADRSNYPVDARMGYFVNNTLAALDTAGEWAYDSAAATVYVKLPGNQKPTDQDLVGSVVSTGLQASSRSHLRFENLTFFGHADTAIQIESGRFLTFQSCKVLYPDLVGVRMTGAHLTFAGGEVRGANQYGLLLKGDSNTVSGNLVLGTGLLPRLNRRGMAAPCCAGRGLDVDGLANRILDNRLDSTGYIGIGFYGRNNRIEANLVESSCMTTDDGAGIYTWSPDIKQDAVDGTVLRRNIVRGSKGSPAGTGEAQGAAHGIYLDDRTHGMVVDSNVSTGNNDFGLFLHNSGRNRVTDNILHGNGRIQLLVVHDGFVADPIVGNRIEGNTVSRTAEPQAGIVMSPGTQTEPMGTLSGNISVLETPFGLELSRDDTLLNQATYVKNGTVGKNLVGNGSFDQGLTGWGTWPEGIAATLDAAGPDGKCAKVNYATDPTDRLSTFGWGGFALQKDSLYRVRFLAKGAILRQSLTFAIRMNYAPWWTTGLERDIALDTAWQAYTYYFRAPSTDPNLGINFSNRLKAPVYWLDSVSVTSFRIDTGAFVRQVHLFTDDSGRGATLTCAASGCSTLDGTPFTTHAVAPGYGLLHFGAAQVPSPPPTAVRAPMSLDIPRLSRAQGRLRLELPSAWSGPVRLRLLSLDGRVLASMERSEASSHSLALPQQQGLAILELRTPHRHWAGRVILP